MDVAILPYNKIHVQNTSGVRHPQMVPQWFVGRNLECHPHCFPFFSFSNPKRVPSGPPQKAAKPPPIFDQRGRDYLCWNFSQSFHIIFRNRCRSHVAPSLAILPPLLRIDPIYPHTFYIQYSTVACNPADPSKTTTSQKKPIIPFCCYLHRLIKIPSLVVSHFVYF